MDSINRKVREDINQERNLTQKQRGMLAIVEGGLVATYDTIRALRDYEGFREIRLKNFSIQGRHKDYLTIEGINQVKGKSKQYLDRLQRMHQIYPMIANFWAIDRYEENGNILEELSKREIINPRDILDSNKVLKENVIHPGVGFQWLCFGLDKDSLIVRLYLFPSNSKNLDDLNEKISSAIGQKI